MAAPGETFYLRETEEPVVVLAVLDAAGTLLVRAPDEAVFEARRDELMSVRERHSCGCCGA